MLLRLPDHLLLPVVCYSLHIIHRLPCHVDIRNFNDMILDRLPGKEREYCTYSIEAPTQQQNPNVDGHQQSTRSNLQQDWN
jgi:hypothetical protein